MFNKNIQIPLNMYLIELFVYQKFKMQKMFKIQNEVSFTNFGLFCNLQFTKFAIFDTK